MKHFIFVMNRFSEWKEGRDALIVLDDVHSEKVVTCLSVGTKLLITTENENIIPVNRKSVTYFEKVRVAQIFTIFTVFFTIYLLTI